MLIKEMIEELNYIAERYGENVDLKTSDEQDITIEVEYKDSEFERPIIVVED
ncbi:hypothetical protein HOR18_gp027 [Staphylococcus phage vB_SscM-1]|uniref:Uncharacterized protein n=2 Tax=Sciuriunavirus SscM1 TaxID=2734053 RepID=A0A1X9I9B5_9CAUD|nr:hypothetical protein HOR18_gp027 [Staphylococcus phage vB_SscM-1]ANT44690.1 hypothetical protein vB_SscM-1_027 [Staphylococcus phage vB_SscM-1]ANT44893.1 hypothetical protein vB_SscM-2_026 [Staphylococcus phage vB_SscM-2]